MWKRWNGLAEKTDIGFGKNGNGIGWEIRNGLRRLLAEKEAIRKRGEAAWMLRKKGGCLAAMEKRGVQLCVCACRRRKNEWGFRFLYVINASSIIIEYVSKCLASLHTSVKSVKSVREKRTQQSWAHRLPRSHRFSCCWLLQLGVSALP